MAQEATEQVGRPEGYTSVRDPITPYAAAKVVTVQMRAKTGSKDFEMQPQTMYGLANRNVIPNFEMGAPKANGQRKVYFDGDAFHEWLVGYLSGGGGTSRSRPDYEKLAEQYITSDEDLAEQLAASLAERGVNPDADREEEDDAEDKSEAPAELDKVDEKAEEEGEKAE